MAMRILAGAVSRQNPEVLAAHLDTMEWQELDSGVEVDLLYVDDNDDPESSILLQNRGQKLAAGPRPNEAIYDVVETTHKWDVTTFEWLAAQKQRLLDLAVQERYDAVFLVDTDLLIGPETLQSLIDTRKPIVSAVFWTRWQPQSPPLPQVWLQHPYELSGRGKEQHEFLAELADRQLTRVYGLGACTLIRTSVLDRVRYSPILSGLPTGGMWQGEDRSFCIRAERNHVEMWADAWPDVWHCYRPSYRKLIEGWKDVLAQGYLHDSPRVVGDLVSFTIEPLEEPQLAGHTEFVRGRLGALQVSPEIEDALFDLDVREERIVRVEFPQWYDLAAYRGRKKLFRVRLLGAKPYEPHPRMERCTQTSTNSYEKLAVSA